MDNNTEEQANPLFLNVLIVRDIEWHNAEKTCIFAMLLFDDREDFLPYSAMKDAKAKHEKIIFDNLASGNFGEIREYVAPEQEAVDKELDL